MEDTKKHCVKSNVEAILKQLDTMDMPESQRTELRRCINDILSVDLEKIKFGTNKNHPDLYQSIVISLIKFSENVIQTLKTFQVLSPQCEITLNAVVRLVQYVCLNKVDSCVLKKFARLQETSFQVSCLATCEKLSQCISYMQGLPDPTKLHETDKIIHLQLMASDIPVQTGTDELLTLGLKIENIVASTCEGDFHQLMESVQLYCCLATFRELFLLYRYAIQSSFGVDANSVKCVIGVQRSRDEVVVKFLYRPTTNTAKYFCKYEAEEWDIVNTFMDRRGLKQEDLSEFGGEVFQIQSNYYEARCLNARRHCLTYAEVMNCESSPDSTSSLFQLQGGKNNLFTIFPCNKDMPCHMRDCKLARLELSTGKPSALGTWCIQKIYPDSATGAPCYVIRLAGKGMKCLYASQINGIVYAKTSNSIGPKHFWDLKYATHLYIQNVYRN